jgi:hypothetical protein
MLSNQGYGIRAGCGNCEKGLTGDNQAKPSFPTTTQDLPQAYEHKTSIESVTTTPTLASNDRSLQMNYRFSIIWLSIISFLF